MLDVERFPAGRTRILSRRRRGIARAFIITLRGGASSFVLSPPPNGV